MNRTPALSIALLFVTSIGWSTNARAQASSAQGCGLGSPPGVSVHEIVSGERPRTYRLFVPSDPPTPTPLVLDLHGSGGTAEGQARNSRLETLAEREGFAVATLEADTGRRWNVPVIAGRSDDIAYVSDVIDNVGSVACIDASRVYSTGFSGGARMTSLLGCRLNGRIAAIAPVAGLRWPAPCDGRPIPVLTFHGLADPQNTYDGHASERGAEWEESVPEALAGWAGHNGCDSRVVLEDPAGPLSTMRYEGCNGDAEVRMIRIDDLGHTWPREEVDATAVMWEFFRRHRLPE
jgi:polyhydroxybutyrate depolymerase